MEIFERTLAKISGGRVLDVATGRGGFAELLAEKLDGYTQIVGVDINERMLGYAVENVNPQHTHFVIMDAECLGFADGSFDTVSISASLHHLADASPTFAEMNRVLRPGGHLVVAEMHRDVITEAQLTSVKLHTWAAKVDLSLGLPHYPTLTRQQIVDLFAELDLRNISIYDWADTDSDPLDKDRLRSLEGVFERYLPRAKRLPDYSQIKAQAEMLRQRLHQVGAQSEPRVAIVGQKSWPKRDYQ